MYSDFFVIKRFFSLNNKIEKLEADLQSAKEKQVKAELAAERYTKENKVSENDKHSEREQRIRLEVTLQERIKECNSLQSVSRNHNLVNGNNIFFININFLNFLLEL